ncbi:MAG: winged helix-turn-helix domain-containing protein [Wenzhouxiangellaceae bacterium]
MIWQFGEFELDSVAFRLTDRKGVAVPIQPKAFRVLECLVRNAPEVVSRDQLQKEVWGHSELCVSALSQVIHEIRRALDDDASQPAIIGTRHGEGYFLLIQPETRGATATRTLSVRGPAFWNMLRIVIFGLAFLLVGIGIGFALKTCPVGEEAPVEPSADLFGAVPRHALPARTQASVPAHQFPLRSGMSISRSHSFSAEVSGSCPS